MEIIEITVKSDSGSEYKITANTNTGEGAFCTCPAWRFAKGVKVCKHIEFVSTKLAGQTR